MKAFLSSAAIIGEIALRNLVAGRWKTVIIGSICAFAALAIVVGSSILGSVDHALQRSIAGSVAGDIQVYSSESKSPLEILGDAYVDVPDIAPLADFAGVRRVLLSVPRVTGVVPMGFSDAAVSWPSAIDQILAGLHESVGLLEPSASAEVWAKYELQKRQLRRILQGLSSELDVAGQVSHTPADVEARKDVERATSDSFWSRFDSEPASSLDFLESRVAPLAAGTGSLSLRFVGTDPAAFAKAFDRMRIVDGAPIARGERGFLFSKRVYEEELKLKAAHGLDYIKQHRDEQSATIADDPELKRIVTENVANIDELLLQLDSAKMDSFRRKLQAFLHSPEEDVAKLLAAFFRADDLDFDRRFAFFYGALAPELSLYRVRMGDMLTIRSQTRRGYVRSVNVRVCGTMAFAGLERSPQAGIINMMDLVTFRDLYGFPTAEQEREILGMHRAAGGLDIDRDSAEAQLFGAPRELGSGSGAASATASSDTLDALLGTRARQASRELASYRPEELEQGSVLNAAVTVSKADDGQIEQTIAAIERAGKEHGLPLKAISWDKSTGLLGQFVTVLRGILLAAVLIIFVVALVVINNALVMATLDRVSEIGALRAIGAQRHFVFALLIVESVVLGVVSGGLGSVLGGVLALLIGKVGIPAGSDVMSFFFSGQRLFPVVSLQHLGLALATVVAVSSISGIYPAWLATRVSPRQAMSMEE